MRKEVGQLTEQFRELADREGWGTQQDYMKWLRKHASGHESYWAPLKRGDPVPVKFARNFVLYWNQLEGRTSFEETEEAVLVSAPSRTSSRKSLILNLYKHGWKGLFRWWMSDKADPLFGRCQSEAELFSLCEMVIQCLGRMHGGQKLSGDEALALGESVMGHSLASYHKWLIPFWLQDRQIAVFGVDDKKSRRLGASVIIPLKEQSYFRFISGKMESFDLTLDDYQAPSPYLLINALGDARRGVWKSIAKLSISQVRALLFQIGAFSPRDFATRPRFVTFDASSENARRAKIFGFLDTGKRTPSSGHRIMELAPPEARAPRTTNRASVTTYEISLALIRSAQFNVPKK